MNKRNQHILLQQLVGVGVLVLLFGIVMTIVHFMPEHTPAAPQGEWIDSLMHTSTKHASSATTIRLHYFDPNTADSLSLSELGLKPWQIRNLQKYRQAGGRFRRATDFRRLYGLTDSAYCALAPYICIDTTYLPTNHYRAAASRDTIQRDSLFPRYVSHKRDTIIELNTTDTSELQIIRGIGPYTAMRIISYREQLGGYYSVHQLREIQGLDSIPIDSIIPHLTADARLIKRMMVNQCTPRRLQRHPYISFTQAKAIYEYRRMNVYLSQLEELANLKELNELDLEKLQYYLDFGNKQ